MAVSRFENLKPFVLNGLLVLCRAGSHQLAPCTPLAAGSLRLALVASMPDSRLQ